MSRLASEGPCFGPGFGCHALSSALACRCMQGSVTHSGPPRVRKSNVWQKIIEVFLTAFCGPGFLRKFRHSRCVSCTKVAAPVFRAKPTLSSAPVVHWGLARIRRRTLCRLGSFALGPCGGLSLAHMSGQRAEPVCCRGHHRSRSLDFPHEQSAAARTSFTTREAPTAWFRRVAAYKTLAGASGASSPAFAS